MNHFLSAASPPFLFVNSSIERFHVGWDKAIALLRAHGISAEVRTINGIPHPVSLFHPWLNATARYVTRVLKRPL
ncbi:MAG: hypothetical protein C4326_05290 [Ignavibacteria bacterium]